MDNLPDGPLLAVLALLTLWSALLTGVQAAQLQVRAAGKHASERSTAVHFSLKSLIFCNTLLRVLASVTGTLLALDLWTWHGPWIAFVCLTVSLLIIAEFAPRRIAASHPEALLGLGNGLLRLPLKLIYPLAWLLDEVAGSLLKLFGVKASKLDTAHNPLETPYPSSRHEQPQNGRPEQAGLLAGIQNLERMSVNDILVPRHEVEGLNMDDPIEEVLEQLRTTGHTRLPVFHDDINAVEGILNVGQVRHMLTKPDISKADLFAACYEPYFVPENTSLQLQLLNFHKQQRRLGIVVDEYGEVLGTVSLADIIEEIVGEFESQDLHVNRHIKPLEDGQYEVEGVASIRELNRSLHWNLPSEGPKTLNGLVTEALESIPDSSVCLKIGPYRLEILETDDNRATRILIWLARPTTLSQ